MATAVYPASAALGEPRHKKREEGPMASQIVEEQILQATLCEIERGLFRVAYRSSGVGPGIQYLPRYQVGTSASDAQSRIEQCARECGYSSVVWQVTLTPPPHARSPAHKQMPLSP
jgi:hypothetical protein